MITAPLGYLSLRVLTVVLFVFAVVPWPDL
jgi:hypothetical protein